MSISGRDLKLTRPGRDLKVMSRPQNVFPKSQHEFHVTTQDFLLLTSARSRHQKGCCDTNPSFLGSDAKMMSRPHLVARTLPRLWAHAGAVVCAGARAAAPALHTCCLPVTTSTLGRDPVLEIGSSHSSFCLAQKCFFFFFFFYQ